jgi:glycogen phosphorylase
VWQGLKPHAEDAEFRKKWAAIKFHNKQALAEKIKEWTGIEVPVAALYDIHIKRIHEYKRQYMNAVSVIYRYKQIKVWPAAGFWFGAAVSSDSNRPGIRLASVPWVVSVKRAKTCCLSRSCSSD